jgi:hypothetical protein
LAEFRHFQPQVSGLPVLHAGRTSQQDVRIKAIALAVLGLAIGESGETAKAPPIRRAGVRTVPLCEGLGDERGEGCRVHIIMLQPGLEVAEAGFNHGARLKAIAGEPVYRVQIEVIKNGEAVLSCWPDIDMRPAGIVGFEEREPGENACGYEVRESGKHSAFTKDAEVVGWGVEGFEHPFDGIPCSIHHGLHFGGLAKRRDMVLHVFLLECTFLWKFTQDSNNQKSGGA